MPDESERWLAVPGWEDHYEVSNLGRVLTHFNPGARRLQSNYQRIMEPSPNKYGYVVVYLTSNGKAVARSVHSLVMEVFVGPRPERLDIRHLNGIRHDNRLENLRYGTRAQNVQDAVVRGTAPREENHGGRKITLSQAEEILRECHAGVSQSTIATRYGLTQQGVSDIKVGKCWKSLDHLRAELWPSMVLGRT